MDKWFDNKKNKYKHRKKNREFNYEFDEGELIVLNSRRKKAFAALVWGFIWLIAQAGLIIYFIKTGIFVSLIPIPLILAFVSFNKFFRLRK